MLKTLRLEYIDEPEPTVRKARLFLDDVDISSFVYGIDISMGIDKVTDVTLHCRGIVELPEDLQALVKVEVDNGIVIDGFTEISTIEDEYKSYLPVDDEDAWRKLSKTVED